MNSFFKGVIVGATIVVLAASLASPCRAAEPEKAVPLCATKGHDCIDYLKQAGPVAFCTWAAGMASIGAWQHEQGAKQPSLTLRNFPRSLTEQESKYIAQWLAFGYSRATLGRMRVEEQAYSVCEQSFL